MAVDKVKLANNKWKRAQRRKKILASRNGETNLQQWKRKQRNAISHHTKKNGENRRNYSDEI